MVLRWPPSSPGVARMSLGVVHNRRSVHIPCPERPDGLISGQHQGMPEQFVLPPVMHRSQLLAAGTTPDEIRTALRRDEWQAVHRGTYCQAEAMAALTTEQRHRLRALALAQRSPQMAVSHLSAAVLLHLPLWDARFDDVHLTRGGRGGSRIGPGRIVHAGRLDPGDVITIHGVRATSSGRTLADLARTTSHPTAVIAADYALAKRMVTPAELALALGAAGHCRGAAAARRALLFADGRSESAGESRTRLALHQGGLPAPHLQVQIYAPDGTFLGRVDLGYPELGVLIEFDGKVKYQQPFRPGQKPEEVVIAEKLREDRLRELGYVVVRFVWSELADPTGMAARINAALERGRIVAAAGGITGTWTAAPPVQVRPPGTA